MVNAGIAVEPLALPVPSPAKILLVDDRSANLLALQAVLDNRGYEIVTAASGQEAVARSRDRIARLPERRARGVQQTPVSRARHS